MKNRAWKYCRQASPDEGLTGLNMQSRIIDQYIAEHELVLVGETKAVESGNSMDCESIREIRTKAEGGAYDILLISGLERLGRDIQQTTAFVRDLLRTGIRIVSVMANEEITEKDFAFDLLDTLQKTAEKREDTPLAKCEACGLKMLKADGCTMRHVFIAGKKYERIGYGAEGGPWGPVEDGERCPDCGALAGHYHHWGCDVERCPFCHGQLISCDCEDVYCEGES